MCAPWYGASFKVVGGSAVLDLERPLPIVNLTVIQMRPLVAVPSKSEIFSIETKLTDLDDPTLRRQALDIPTAFRVSEADRSFAAHGRPTQSGPVGKFRCSLQSVADLP